MYKWFFDNLSVTKSVKDFIKTRRYPNSVIEMYNLKGVDDYETFFQRCKDKWGIDIMLQCGLAKEVVNEDTGEIKCKFTWWTNTLFFPFYDKAGNIMYIQGRTLNPEFDKTYKYVNLSGVETIPFNLPLLKELHDDDDLVITEGVTDCISCCLMGKNAVGIIGAYGFKKEYAELLKNFKINIIPDNDKNKTGEKFAEKIREYFHAIGKTITVHSLIGYKDISEYYMNKWEHGQID